MFLVFEVTPQLSFKGTVVLEASSIIWWIGESPEIPSTPRLAFQLTGLVSGTSNPQSPYGSAGRGASSSSLMERKQQQQLSCAALGSDTAECYGALSKMEKCGSS